MAHYPEPLERLVKELKKLPGIGQRTAERLVFYLLNQPEEEVRSLSEALVELKAKITLCQECFSFAEGELCEICQDPKRDRSIICVVSSPQELWKIEKAGGYHGLYHVLGGLISPVNDVHPEDLRIQELMRRLQRGGVKEVILALDPTVEGEHTAMYLARQIKPLGIAVTRIAQGVPIGRDLEFADELTLSRALQGRVAVE
jgi:recombination protein RecR